MAFLVDLPVWVPLLFTVSVSSVWHIKMMSTVVPLMFMIWSNICCLPMLAFSFVFFVADLLSIVLFDLSEFYFWSILLSAAWSDQIKVVVTFFIWICCRENVPNDINYLAWWTSLSQNLVVLRLWFECSYPSLILATKREMGSSYTFLTLQPNKKRGRTLPSNQTWDGIIPSLKRGMILSHPMLTPNQTHP